MRELLFYKPERRGTRIQSALEHLNHVVHKRAVVFLISDLLDQGYEQALKVANRKHDLVILQIADPREEELPDLGILAVRDAETGEIVYIDTALPRVREFYRQNWERNQRMRWKLFQSHRIDNVTINTGQDYAIPLIRFFEERARRLR